MGVSEVDRFSNLGGPMDPEKSIKRIDLSQSLRARKPIEQPRFFSGVGNHTKKVDLSEQIEGNPRLEKRIAPLTFFDAYQSLEQVYQPLFFLKSEYEDFMKFERVIDDIPRD